MDLFEEIRREYEFGLASISGVARKFGVHRRMVREAIESSIPMRLPVKERPRPTIAPLAEFIDEILQADRQAPRKQRHTAHRIWVRINRERAGYPIAESTVREYVRERKQTLGLRVVPEAFVPQQYAWGDEAQVDWYEADVDLDDERVTVQVFAMRSMASGAAFHRAYLRATQQAFLEAHELGFHYLGGTFRRLRYDNLGSAVKKILRGFRREETARFVAFRSHWNFEASFCTPGEGHEKGGVEGEVGTFRRNHLVPVPAARDLEDLNVMLLGGCREDEARHIDGRAQTVGEALAIERQHLLPMAREGFDLVEVSFGKVNGLGCVKARTNAYSTPLAPGTKAQIRLTATTVEVWYEGRCVARHARCYGRYQHVLDLEHYLDVLEHKPGAFAGSKPLEQWRRAGRWPVSYDRFWTGLMQRHGRQDGTRAMIELLQLGRRLGWPRLRSAIESALQLGCADAAAVQHLMATDELRHQRPSLLLEVGNLLSQYERPLPEMHVYDELLVGAAR